MDIWGRRDGREIEGDVERKHEPALSPPIITFPAFRPVSSRIYRKLSTPCSSCPGYIACGASVYAGNSTARFLPAALACSTIERANWRCPLSAGTV